METNTRQIPLLLLALLLSSGCTMSSVKPRPSVDSVQTPRVLNIGHRGAAGLAPENTMAAFQAAVKAGADGVELDVMLTADRRVVVFHDYTLQKRDIGQGVVRKMDLGHLRRFDLSSYFFSRFPKLKKKRSFAGANAPTLSEVLAYFAQHPKMLINIELKNKDLVDRGLETRVAELVRQSGMSGRVLISSFNPFSLWRMKRVAPHLRRGLLFSPNSPVYVRDRWFAQLASPDALHPKHTLVDADFMKKARQGGHEVNVWTVNEPAEMRRLIDLGVSGIITDFPDRLAGAIKAGAGGKAR